MPSEPRNSADAISVSQVHATEQSPPTLLLAPVSMLAASARRALRAAASSSASRAARPYSATVAPHDRIVVAVGGNALQRRGDRLTIENMLKAAAEMAPTVAALHADHEVVLTHGNGPQVGELALERSNATFDVLGAESMGQIGYVLAQALASQGVNACPIVCQVVVDAQSDAFKDPSKFVGPVYGAKEAHALGTSLGWIFKPDGEYYRRVVPSPLPEEILQIDAISTLLESGKDSLVIACGGGGVPVSRVPSCPTTLQGVEAVIDKDMCGAKLACDLKADGYIILTDGGGIWKNFGKPDAMEMSLATPEYLLGWVSCLGPCLPRALFFLFFVPLTVDSLQFVRSCILSMPHAPPSRRAHWK